MRGGGYEKSKKTHPTEAPPLSGTLPLPLPLGSTTGGVTTDVVTEGNDVDGTAVSGPTTTLDNEVDGTGPTTLDSDADSEVEGITTAGGIGVGVGVSVIVADGPSGTGTGVTEDVTPPSSIAGKLVDGPTPPPSATIVTQMNWTVLADAVGMQGAGSSQQSVGAPLQ